MVSKLALLTRVAVVERMSELVGIFIFLLRKLQIFLSMARQMTRWLASCDFLIAIILHVKYLFPAIPQAFWNKYPGRSNQLLRETLKRMHDDLEDTESSRPAWKKERSFLTPDIESQEFMGDIMMSNTYLTQRIPANWDDPE